MSNFWPSGIELSDTQSPKDILETAQEDWHTSSDGVMELVLQDAESNSGNSMIIVHAKHVASNRTATLFSVVHRPGNPYPATIQPKDEDLPDFLKKSYSYKPPSRVITSFDEQLRIDAQLRINAQLLGAAGKSISNEWVSDTPTEFRRKLAEAFNLGIIKREILNLASNATDNANSTNGESLEESVEN
jgi:hypothetical protein